MTAEPEPENQRLEMAFERQLAVFEALRRLGFSSDDIYFGFNNGGALTVLRTQGLEFVVAYPDVPPLTCSGEEFIHLWQAKAETWNTSMTELERKEIFEKHILRTGASGDLVMALRAKGFYFPADESIN